YYIPCIIKSVIFFFQAEDGIRDFHVTGVQTCALPIYACPPLPRPSSLGQRDLFRAHGFCGQILRQAVPRWRDGAGPRFSALSLRSEERRVGKDSKSQHSENCLRSKI